MHFNTIDNVPWIADIQWFYGEDYRLNQTGPTLSFRDHTSYKYVNGPFFEEFFYVITEFEINDRVLSSTGPYQARETRDAIYEPHDINSRIRDWDTTMIIRTLPFGNDNHIWSYTTHTIGISSFWAPNAISHRLGFGYEVVPVIQTEAVTIENLEEFGINKTTIQEMYNVENLNLYDNELINKEKFEQQVIFNIKERGKNIEEAKKSAYKNLLRETAILEASKELGITVSQEEALNKSREVRGILESKNIKGSKEALEVVENIIAELNMNKGEYWNKYAVIGYKNGLLKQKLKDIVSKDNNSNEWNNFVDKVVDEYIDKNKEELDKFKRSVGIK